jgi:hypothetical protein
VTIANGGSPENTSVVAVHMTHIRLAITNHSDVDSIQRIADKHLTIDADHRI